MSRNQSTFRHITIACSIFFVSYVFVALAQPGSTGLPKKVKHENYEDRMDRIIKELKEHQDKKYNEIESKVTQLNNKVKQLETDIESLLQNGIQFKTCAEMHKSSPCLKSGMFWIDPDGHGVGDGPIRVYCNMTDGTTSILHNLEKNTSVRKCGTPGCYTKSVTYNASHKQIKALADASFECHQSIRYDCLQAPFMKGDVQFSWWDDRNGRNQSFWSGNGSTNHTCECGHNRNCFDSLLSCNCDSLAPAPLSDFGVITNKNYLPITRLNFGGTEWPTSSGNHTLGRFNCSGIKELDQIPNVESSTKSLVFKSKNINQGSDQLPSSCNDLQRIGHTLSGFYSVKMNKSIEMVYCNFAENQDIEKRIGQVDVKTPVYFYVKKNTSQRGSGRITFEIEVVNIGGAININSGYFVAPRNGTYFFIFSATMYNEREEYSDCRIFLWGMEKGDVDTRFEGKNKEPSSASLHATSYLRAGAQVFLYKNYDHCVLYNEEVSHYTHFSGGLLQEDL